MRRAPAIFALLLAAGCGGPDVITKATLEKTVSDQLTANGHAHTSVTCGGDVRAVVTESTSCVMTTAKGKFPVIVFVKAVDNGQATYALKIGDRIK